MTRTLPLDELIAIDRAWRAERSALYQQLLESFTPKQRALWDARNTATKWVQRCDLWERAIRTGHILQETAIRPIWPNAEAEQDWRMQRIIAAYYAQRQIHDLAAEAGLSRQGFHILLRRYHVVERPRACAAALPPRRAQAPVEAIISAYYGGERVPDIASKTGRSIEAVYEILRRYHVVERAPQPRLTWAARDASDTANVIIADYYAGASFDLLAQRHTRTRAAIQILLRRYHVVERPEPAEDAGHIIFTGPPKPPRQRRRLPAEIKARLADSEWLSAMYPRHSQSEIAALLGVGRETIQRAIQTAGLTIIGQRANPHRQRLPEDIRSRLADAAWLREMYQQHTIAEIARQLGVANLTVRKALAAADIPIRSDRQRPPERQTAMDE